MQGELAIDHVALSVCADAGGAEGERRVGLDLEEVLAADMVVALLVVGVERRRQVDLGGDRGLG